MISGGITIPLHFAFLHLYVNVWGLGVEGIGYANVSSGFVNMSFTLLYSLCVPSIREAIQWPNASTLEGLYEYMRLGVPILIIQCSDRWAFNITTVISGKIGVDAQAAFVVLQILVVQIWMTPMGIQEAVCVIVGNCIGDRNPELAWRYWKMTSLITWIYSVILTSVLIIYKEAIFSIFTSEPNMLTLLYGAMPIVAIKYIFDAYQGVLQGTIRALGMQKQASWICVTIAYTVTIPVGCVLAFYFELGINGLVLGSATSNLL